MVFLGTPFREASGLTQSELVQAVDASYIKYPDRCSFLWEQNMINVEKTFVSTYSWYQSTHRTSPALVLLFDLYWFALDTGLSLVPVHNLHGLQNTGLHIVLAICNARKFTQSISPNRHGVPRTKRLSTSSSYRVMQQRYLWIPHLTLRSTMRREKDMALAEWSALILFSKDIFMLTNFGKMPLHNRDRQGMLHTNRYRDTRESGSGRQAAGFQLEQSLSTVIEWWWEGLWEPDQYRIVVKE
jgi:hypothetical protein